MKNKKLFTQIFNPRLFIEALKRLRVIGLATAILSVTISALVPIAVWMIRAPKFVQFTMDTQVLCVPVCILVFMAPMFFSTLFSFLQKRKESDFFHAIPYTRICVYVSFTAAALAFVFAIQVACGLVAGILWSMMPNLTFDLSGMIAYVFICMLAAAMLSSFMMLALTVSGTGGSGLLLFLLFAGFVRVVCAIFMVCVGSIDLIPSESMDFFVPTWFLPINIIWYLGEIKDATVIMYSFSNILYSLAVTIGVYVLAGFFYCKRKSEMAGNPAPGVRTQALFRILFTLPLALVIPLCLITDSDDSTLLLVLTVAILLVYFLYELITTKRPKNMLRAIPGLAIVAGVCILFSLAFYGYRTVVLYEKVDTEDIKSVSIDSNIFGHGTYQSYLVDSYAVNDEGIRAIIADQLEESQERERLNHHGEMYWNRSTVTIRLKGGRTMKRSIILSPEQISTITQFIREEEEVGKLMYRLPADREINGSNLDVMFDMHTDNHHFYDESDIRDLMEVFRAEFEALTDTQKDSVMAATFVEGWDSMTGNNLVLSLYGRVEGGHFRNSYYITEEMPMTRRYLLVLSGLSAENWFSDENDSVSGTASTLLQKLDNNLEQNVYEKLAVTIQGFSATGKVEKDILLSGTVSDDTLRELVALLAERNRIKNAEDLRDPYQKIFLTNDTYYIHLSIDGESMKNRYLSVSISGLYELTPEEWKTVERLLTEKTEKIYE